MQQIKNSGKVDVPRIGRIIFSPENHVDNASAIRRRALWSLAAENKVWLLIEGIGFLPQSTRKNKQIVGIDEPVSESLTLLVSLYDTTVDRAVASNDRNVRHLDMRNFFGYFMFEGALNPSPVDVSAIREGVATSPELQQLMSLMSQWKSDHPVLSENASFEQFVDFNKENDNLFLRCIRKKCLEPLLKVMIGSILRNIHDDKNHREFWMYIESSKTVQGQTLLANQANRLYTHLQHWRDARMVENVLKGIGESAENGQNVYVITGALHTLPIVRDTHTVLQALGRTDIKLDIDTTQIEHAPRDSDGADSSFSKEVLRQLTELRNVLH